MARKFSHEDLIKAATKMRKNPTHSELLACNILDAHIGKGNYIFQQVFGFYILDIVIKDRLLIVEIDGIYHMGREIRDSKRDSFCNRCGMRVLRIENHQVPDIISHINKYNKIQGWELKLSQAILMAKQIKEEYERADRERMMRGFKLDSETIGQIRGMKIGYKKSKKANRYK